jgi:hypothetical protein
LKLLLAVVAGAQLCMKAMPQTGINSEVTGGSFKQAIRFNKNSDFTKVL